MTVIVGEEYDSCTGIILGSYFDGTIVFYGIDATASYPRYEYYRAGTENLHLTPSAFPWRPLSPLQIRLSCSYLEVLRGPG